MSNDSHIVRNTAGINPAVQMVRAALAKGLEGVDPAPAVVSVKRLTRTLEQNAKMWAMLGDIANQVEWYGQLYDADTWKVILMHGLGKEQRMIPAVSGGIISVPHRSSQLTVGDMSDLIEYMSAFGVDHGVRWSAPKRYAGG